MSKISELSDGGVIQGGDTLIAVRSGGNVKVTYGGSTTANIDGGTIDGTVIGGTTPAAGTFTSLTASGDVNFDSNTLFVDASANAVGIGVSTPAAPLSFGSITNDARIYLRGNTNEFAIGTNGLQTVYAGYAGHVFQTGSFGGAERFRIDASGNLILGGTTAITDTGTPSLTLGNGAGNPSLNFYGTSAGQAGQISFGDATSGTGAYEGYLLYDNANNFMAFGTNHTERARLDSAGHLIVPNGITLGTAVGTYNAANTLDDYEEGTWTPALTFETAGDLSVVYAAERIGTYRKIGDLVIAQFSVQCTTFTHTTASGNLQMTGLPFASVRSSSDFSGVGLNSFQGITKANYTQIGATTLNGGSYIFFSICGSGQAGENVTAADTPSGTLKLLRGTVIYRA
jgi:hypothetical protein